MHTTTGQTFKLHPLNCDKKPNLSSHGETNSL